ncbi:MAG: VWA domain-containing protein [Gammaproteobacteria bacterium]
MSRPRPRLAVRLHARAAGAARCATLLTVVVLALATGAAYAAPTDLMLVLDNSGSMRKNDPQFLLEGAVAAFVDGLAADTRAGLVIFDETVDYAVPLATLDDTTRGAIDNAVGGIDYRGQYTNSPAAIERAIYELKNDARDGAGRVIIFMTDGIVDTGNAGIDAEKTKWLREDLAADAAASGIRVFGIAFTENADFFLIQSLAAKTGGEYFRAADAAELAGVFDAVQAQLAAPPAAAAVPEPAPAPVPAGPAVPSSPAAPAAAPAAAAGSCLDTVSADERALMLEAAPDAGMSAEELCREMMAPSDSGVIIKRPGEEPRALDAPAAPRAVDEPGAGPGIALLLVVAIVLLAIVVGAVWFIRRRGSGVVALGAGARAARIPEAFLKDVQGVADEPAVQLGAKPLMIGRVAGTDPEHVDYYVINKGTVGRRHAIIQYRDFGFWLSDQGSVNGTFLNGQRIEGERQLKHGDRIRFHKYDFEFSMPEMADAGHTVFADPNDPNATMIDDGSRTGSMIASMAATGAAAAPSRPHGSIDPDSVFDVTGEGDVEAVAVGRAPVTPLFDEAEDDTPTPEKLDAMLDRAAALSAREDDAEDDFDEDDTAAPTAVPDAVPDDVAVAARPTPPGAVVIDDPDAFDAEASAFFDDGELGSTASPYGVSVPPPSQLDDDDDDDDGELVTAMPTAAAAQFEDEFTEAETLLPNAPESDAASGDATGAEVSLDDFMQTESFDARAAAAGGFFDEDDATLQPEPAVDADSAVGDFFDVTSEGTIPPVEPRDDRLDDDYAEPDADDDGDDDPRTRFRG